MPLSAACTQHLQTLYQQVQHYLFLDRQNQCGKTMLLQQLIAVLPTLVAIDDEELYGFWKVYQDNERTWNQTIAPNYTSAKGAAYPPALQAALDHLVALIKAAQDYLEGYKEHQEDIVGEIMKERFKQYNDYIEGKLHDPNQGWLFFQTLLQQTQQFVGHSQQYNQLHTQWKTRVIPNAAALLTDEKDIATAEQLVALMQVLRTFFKDAPISLKKNHASWETLANSGKWEKRLEDLKIRHHRSQARQVAVLEDGNPAIAEKKPYTYQEPNKKSKLYRKGRGDEDAIHPNDIEQGDLDNCYVLSPIGALAQANPDLIREMIQEQADGTFEVTLYLRTDADSEERKKTVVTVKREFVYNKNGKAVYAGEGDQELWVRLLEKTYAQALGHYDAMAEGGDAAETFEVLTGKKTTKGSIKNTSQETLQLIFEKALAAKKPVAVSSIIFSDKIEYLDIGDNQGIYTNHVYYRVTEVFEQRVYCFK